MADSAGLQNLHPPVQIRVPPLELQAIKDFWGKTGVNFSNSAYFNSI
ncbi:hypothetical protein H6G04_16790 [Calothrix membranacea FACHB-236]|nr:hypothetical protein [Calothrix membranacea FACHB-236]